MDGTTSNLTRVQSMLRASMMGDNMTDVNQNEMNIVGSPSSMNGNCMNVWYIIVSNIQFFKWLFISNNSTVDLPKTYDNIFNVLLNKTYARDNKNMKHK